MLPKSLEKTLSLLNSCLTNHLKWAVDGSCALALQSMEIKPHDIDLLTDRSGAYETEKILNRFVQYPVTYSETEKYRSHFGIFLIDGVKVEIMGDLQTFRNGKWSIVMNPDSTGVVFVNLIDGLIPVVPLGFLKGAGYIEERLKKSTKII